MRRSFPRFWARSQWPLLQQYGRRIPDHRPHAAHVQDPARAEKIMSRSRAAVSSISLILSPVALFILSLKWLSSPASAQRGVLAGEIGAALAVVATLSNPESSQYKWIVIALIIGAGSRHSPGPGADDRGAAADRPEPRLWRAFRGHDRYRRISTWAPPHVTRFRDGRDRAGSDHRLAHVSPAA